MKTFEWFTNPQTINQSILKGLVWGTVVGTAIFVATDFAFDHIFEESPSHVCGKTEIYGSSKWVACVDRVVEERAKKGHAHG